MSSMGESISRLTRDDARLQQISQVTVKGDLAEAYDDTNSFESIDLSSEMLRTHANLRRSGLVTGRSAPYHGGNPCIAELQTIITRACLGLIRQADFVQNRVHKISRTIACKRTPGSIRSMRARSQPENQDAGPRIAEARNGPTPIRLIQICTALCLRNALAILSQSRASFAIHNCVVSLLQGGRKLIEGRFLHYFDDSARFSRLGGRSSFGFSRVRFGDSVR